MSTNTSIVFHIWTPTMFAYLFLHFFIFCAEVLQCNLCLSQAWAIVGIFEELLFEFNENISNSFVFLDKIEQGCKKGCVDVPKFLDIHENDFLVTFTNGGDGSNKVLAQSVQHINIIGFGFKELNKNKISFFFGFEPPITESGSCTVHRSVMIMVWPPPYQAKISIDLFLCKKSLLQPSLLLTAWFHQFSILNSQFSQYSKNENECLRVGFLDWKLNIFFIS